MATKRPNETGMTSLVPVQQSKKTKSEIVAYAAKNRRVRQFFKNIFTCKRI
jgi:hypothetical protein